MAHLVGKEVKMLHIDRNDVIDLVDDGLCNMLHTIYSDLGVESGDESPFQKMKWESIVEYIADYFIKQVAYNLPEQYCGLHLEELDN